MTMPTRRRYCLHRGCCLTTQIIPLRWHGGGRNAKRGLRSLSSRLQLSSTNTIRFFSAFPFGAGHLHRQWRLSFADHSLAGKTVVTFATFGSGGIDSATADVVKAQPEATVIKGYGVRNARIEKAPAEISRFLIENGMWRARLPRCRSMAKHCRSPMKMLQCSMQPAAIISSHSEHLLRSRNAVMTARMITDSM